MATKTATVTVSAFMVSIFGAQSCQVQVPEQTATVTVDDESGLISLTPGSVSASTGPSTRDRYMFAFTRLRPPGGALLVADFGSNYVLSRIIANGPQYQVNSIRCHFAGFASTQGGNSPQETVLPGNDTTIDAFYIQSDTGQIQATFAGGQSAVIRSGDLGAWTDEINLPRPLAIDAAVAFLTSYSTRVGENQIPVYKLQRERGERAWGASSKSDLQRYLSNPAASSSDVFVAAYGGPNQPAVYGPDMCVAKGWDGRPVVLAVTDSIGTQEADYAEGADQRGNLGYLRKWLDFADPTYGRTPHFAIGLSGAGSARELTTNATKRWEVLDQAAAFNIDKALPFTVMLNQLGQNDNSPVFDRMRTNYKGFVTRFRNRYPGIRTGAIGVFPRTSSTDNYRTRTGQTQDTGNEWAIGVSPWGAGNKWQLEAAKEAGLDGTLAYYIDTRPSWFDASTPATWPGPAYVAQLAVQAGTDGTASYQTIQTTIAPKKGVLLRWGPNGDVVGVVAGVDGPGPYLVTLDRNNTAVALQGSAIFAPATSDGVHPRALTIDQIVSRLPQSNKALFRQP